MNGLAPTLRRERTRLSSGPAIIETLEGRRLLTGIQTQLLIDVDSSAHLPLRTVTVTVHKVFPSDAPIAGTASATYQVNDGPVVSLGMMNVDASGVATFVTPTPLPNGSATKFTASYSGDETYAGSTDPGFVLVIPGVGTATTLTASTATPMAGEPVTFTAHVASLVQGFGTANDTVTFTIDGRAQPTVPITVTDGQGQASFTTSTLTPGAHSVVATYNALADSDPYGSSTSPALSVTVPSITPAVAPSVSSLQRFGFHAQPTRVVLTFSQALDPQSAQSASNYRILDPHGHRVAIGRAVYDPNTLTVTLSPAKRLNVHRSYRLTVRAALKGANGLPLDGAGSGRIGSDYAAVINRKTLVIPTS